MKFKSKALKLFYENNDASKLQPHHVDIIDNILQLMDFAESPEDLRLPLRGFHKLKGHRKDTYAVTVQANWRITFKYEDGIFVVVDYEDYH